MNARDSHSIVQVLNGFLLASYTVNAQTPLS